MPTPTTSSPVLSRRSFAKLALAGSGALALGGALAGCSQPTDEGDGAGAEDAAGNASGDAQTQVIVTMPTGAEPAAGFDPFVSWGCGEHVHEPLIQSTLVVTNADMSFSNDLATDYSCSEDGLTWTFSLRKDAVFSDGEPLTAADVAFTINGILASPTAEADLSMVDEAVMTGDYTVELHLNRPFNILLYTLANVGICPEHAHGDDYGAHPIGSGRYVLTQWDKGQQVIFDANPTYYGEKPRIERLVVLFMDRTPRSPPRRRDRSTSPTRQQRSPRTSSAATTCSTARRSTRAASRCRRCPPDPPGKTAASPTKPATTSPATGRCVRR